MNILLTGTTGMIGRSVFNECFESDAVGQILIVNRRSLAVSNPKVTEVLHADFTDFGPLAQAIADFRPDACFHCMGVSSIGMDEAEFSRLTYDVSKSLADVVYAANPAAVFTYVSGTGTDGTERGSTMWARVKGKTENMILNRGFKDAYAFRIGAVIPEKGVKSTTGWVNTLLTLTRPIHGWLSGFASIITSSQLGRAMIRVAQTPAEPKVLENGDIGRIAGENYAG